MNNLSHRKGKLKIRVTDKVGNGVSNAKVEIKQKNHEFLFGCGGFDVMAYVLAKDKADEGKKFRSDSCMELFNYMTLPVYWGQFEPVEGEPLTENIRKTAAYLKEHNIKVKGHPLCWHTVCADWLLKYDNNTIFNKQIERIYREVGDFKGLIDMWDVINEVVIMPVFDKYDNAVTRICNELGQVELVKSVFDAASKTNPSATLLLNDFNTTPKYEELIERCLDAGGGLSAIGIQSHQHQGYWGKEKVLDVLERFGRFNLPIHFTENTLISGDIMPAYIEDLNDWQVKDWPSTPEGEERQTREMEEMYTLLFSDKNVCAITAWDFSDGAWLNAPSGFMRRDNTLKPAYHMLKGLIKDEWATNTTAVTDERGYVEMDAFKGSYEINVGEARAIALTDGECCHVKI